jgi:hypothetical protein
MRDRAVGALLGLAVGDAVGTTLEFTHKPKLAVLADLVGSGPFERRGNGLTIRQWRSRSQIAAWHDTPAMLKMLRLAEHIQWAAQHGRLELVGKILRELREEEWFHIGD